VQEVTSQSVELACVDQGYSNDVPGEVAKQHGIQLEVIKQPQAKRDFVLLPWRSRSSGGKNICLDWSLSSHE